MKKLIRFTEADGDKIHKAWLNHQAKTGKRISFNKWVAATLINQIDAEATKAWAAPVEDDEDLPFV